MADNPLGVGLVGAGGFGQFCLESYAAMPGVHIAAIADVDMARAEKLARTFSARAYPSLEAMLADPGVDIVHLSTPPYLHGPQGQAVIAAGRHLLCEKPLALGVEEGRALIDAAREKGVQLTVDYVMRHNPFWQACAALARSERTRRAAAHGPRQPRRRAVAAA